MSNERLKAGGIFQGMPCRACMLIAVPMKWGDRAKAAEFCSSIVNCES